MVGEREQKPATFEGAFAKFIDKHFNSKEVLGALKNIRLIDSFPITLGGSHHGQMTWACSSVHFSFFVSLFGL